MKFAVTKNDDIFNIFYYFLQNTFAFSCVFNYVTVIDSVPQYEFNLNDHDIKRRSNTLNDEFMSFVN